MDMMRRILCLLLLSVFACIFLFCGCNNNEDAPEHELISDKSAALIETGTDTQKTIAEPEASTENGEPDKGFEADNKALVEDTHTNAVVRTNEPASDAGDIPPNSQESRDLPPGSLHFDVNEYPRVDGSTATIPLSILLARTVTGMSQSEAEIFVSHNKTTQSFYRFATKDADLLLVYEPAQSVFDDLKIYTDLSRTETMRLFFKKTIGSLRSATPIWM